MTTIIGHGGYVPAKRIARSTIQAQANGIPRGISTEGASSVPSRDENHVTMASEAADIALRRADVSGDDLDGCFASSVTDPFASHGLAAHVGYRCGATGDVRTADFRGTTRAATDAFVTACSYVEAEDATVLLTAADIMPVEAGHSEEAISGACAGAIVLGTGVDGSVAEVNGVGQESTGFVERHRVHAAAANRGDRRFEIENGMLPALQQASSRALEHSAGVPDTAIVNAPYGAAAENLIRELSEETDYETTFDSIGFAGTATFLLDLVFALETAEPGELVMAANYGAGGGDVVSLTTEPGVTADHGTSVSAQIDARTEVPYVKHLTYRDRFDDGGRDR